MEDIGAENEIQKTNHLHVGESDREYGVTRFDPTPGPPQACLFVAALPTTTTELALRVLFERFGCVHHVKLFKDKSDKLYAFIQFQTVAMAESALAYASSEALMLDGRALRVERAKVSRTLFLAKLPKFFTNKDLRGIAEEYGAVETVTIIKTNQSKKSKGCGFVKYASREDAVKAINGLRLKNRRWIVEWANSPNDPEALGVDRNSIFIGGLNPKKITREILEAKFSVHGAIESVHLVNNVEKGSSSVSGGDSPRDSTSGASSNTASTSTVDIASQSLAAELADSADVPVVSDGLKEEDLEKFEDEPTRNNAYAFIRFSDPASAVAAIEYENDQIFLQRRLRVQYCETQEMKLRKKIVNYQTIAYGSASPFYESVPFPPPPSPHPLRLAPQPLPPIDHSRYPVHPHPWFEQPISVADLIPAPALTRRRPTFVTPTPPPPPPPLPMIPQQRIGGWYFIPQVPMEIPIEYLASAGLPPPRMTFLPQAQQAPLRSSAGSAHPTGPGGVYMDPFDFSEMARRLPSIEQLAQLYRATLHPAGSSSRSTRSEDNTSSRSDEFEPVYLSTGGSNSHYESRCSKSDQQAPARSGRWSAKRNEGAAAAAGASEEQQHVDLEQRQQKPQPRQQQYRLRRASQRGKTTTNHNNSSRGGK